ncbi:MAG: GNAT family N-acetyltransferase [Bacteroidota bacterium]
MDVPPLLRLTLRDGTTVGLRPVTPDDAGRLVRGFEALSLESRRFRFLSPLSRLTDEQAQYLASVDQRDHVAWGAVPLHSPEADGLGVGRMVRLPRETAVAEFSLVVTDDAQGSGLGSMLFALLVALAPSRGIDTLRGYVAADNVRMTRWMRRLGATAHADASEITFDLPTDLARLSDALRREVHQIREAARKQGIPLHAS